MPPGPGPSAGQSAKLKHATPTAAPRTGARAIGRPRQVSAAIVATTIRAPTTANRSLVLARAGPAAPRLGDAPSRVLGLVPATHRRGAAAAPVAACHACHRRLAVRITPRAARTTGEVRRATRRRHARDGLHAPVFRACMDVRAGASPVLPRTAMLTCRAIRVVVAVEHRVLVAATTGVAVTLRSRHAPRVLAGHGHASRFLRVAARAAASDDARTGRKRRGRRQRAGGHDRLGCRRARARPHERRACMIAGRLLRRASGRCARQQHGSPPRSCDGVHASIRPRKRARGKQNEPKGGPCPLANRSHRDRCAACHRPGQGILAGLLGFGAWIDSTHP